MGVSREDVEALFDVVPVRCSGDEIVFICPQPGCHDSSGNRSVNVRTEKTNCFRCNVGGNFFTWARRLGFVIEAKQVVSTSTTSDLLSMLSSKPGVSSSTIRPVAVNVRLPKGSVRVVDHPDSAYAMVISHMAMRKNLSLDDMVAADVHFTRKDPLWDQYAIFPVYEYGQLVFYQGRFLLSNPNALGKRNPAKGCVPFGASYWVYNVDMARRPGVEVVIVVESILNCLSLQRKLATLDTHNVASVAVFKHAVSAPQLSKLMAIKNLKEVCLMYDADATGEARKQATYLPTKVRRTVAVMPWTKEHPTLDPNDAVDVAWQAFLDRDDVTASSSLLEIVSTI